MVWEATHQCNLDCAGCYGRAGRAKQAGSLDTESVKSLVRDAVRMGLFCLVISGGEPLLRDDVFAIRRYASDLGLFVSLTTNGLLITDANSAEVSKFDHITVSTDGAHEAARAGSGWGDNGGAEDLVHRIRALRRLSPGLIANIQMVVDAGNWAGLLAANRKFNGLGVDAFFQLRYGAKFEIDAGEWCDMIARMRFRSRRVGWIQKRFLHLFPGIAGGSLAAPCLALTSGFVVSPEGRLLPCSFRRTTVADLNQECLDSVWDSMGGLRRYYASKRRACTCANTCFVMPAMMLS